MDIAWYVTAMKEMTTVAEETIDQIGKPRSSAEQDEQDHVEEEEGEEEELKAKAKAKGKGKGKEQEEGKEQLEKKKRDIVNVAHKLRDSMANLATLILETPAQSAEAKTFGVYRKKLIDALNELVVTMKRVWDFYA